ncbi:MAG: hypothetical protein RL514_4707 [Verrucomicrobiota bacterium]|jgi:hypothetical protein
MGRQTNKVQKRARRASYNERKKEAIKAKVQAKAKAKAK